MGGRNLQYSNKANVNLSTNQGGRYSDDILWRNLYNTLPKKYHGSIFQNVKFL